jgi:large conductance mechanosensitive channel
MSFMSEFKEFAMKGNVVDLAVGVIIGAAFGKIVDSIVKDLIMPIVGKIFGGLDFSNYFIKLSDGPAGIPQTYEALTKAGVPVFAYGNFITVAFNFIILAFIIFMMVKQVNRMKKTALPAPVETPEDTLLLRDIRSLLKK